MPQKRLKGLEKLVFGTVFLFNLAFNPLSTKAMAQQYEPCNPQNPNYCTECRDESKRDFARCGEIDYRGVDLMGSGKIPPSPPYLPPDYDQFTGKGVTAADIGKEGKSEIFIGDIKVYKDEQGRTAGRIDPTTQKRLTWDGSGEVINANAFFTKDRSVAYNRIYISSDKKEYFVINLKNGKKTQIDFQKFKELYNEIHNTNRQIVVPPSN